ncbi:MAG: hypothetical protein K2H40_14665 [Lachnospiraceae bacterium]|nr:hypothetical protein [Lachnospiraceae bacterium]
MQQNIRKTADDTDYTIEREYLGNITVTELIEQIIRTHLFPSSGQGNARLQADENTDSQAE